MENSAGQAQGARFTMDFEIQRCSRRCAVTGRDLKPGETFYSVLCSRGADVVRSDYAEESWKGPPDESLGWWKSQMPDANARKIHWAPNDVMLHYFEQLDEHEDRQDVRYVLALLMLRRRIVRLEERQHDDRGRELMILYCPRNETEYQVTAVDPSPQRISVIQQELARLLFADAA